MTDSPVFVGSDVSNARLEIAVRPAGTIRSVPHEEAGLATMVEELRQLRRPWWSWKPRAAWKSC